MPNDKIDDFNNAIRHATEQTTSLLIKHLQNPTTIYPEDLEEPITYVNGMSAPTIFAVTTEYSEEFLRQIRQDMTSRSAVKITRDCEVCEVCGEPLPYTPYHICTRCRIAAQKFRDCLRDEEL